MYHFDRFSFQLSIVSIIHTLEKFRMELAQEHPKEFFTSDGHLIVSDVPQDQYSIQMISGQDTNRFANLALVSDDAVLYASGNTLNLLNIKSQSVQQLQQNSPHGVLCCTNDPTGKLVAVGYQAQKAFFRIFTVDTQAQEDTFSMSVGPELYLNQKHEIQTQSLNGIEVCRFSNDSKLIAVVTNAPEYFMYVYEVDTGKLFLKQNAFSQLVSQISFTRYSGNTILTGGKQHFKQWQMADTFTGSKLKGELAKFGLLDASDTLAFIELPCGNYLSGQNGKGGEIALWDQSNVKQIFKKCHDGGIQFMILDVDGIFYQGQAGQELRKLVEARGTPNPGDNWGGSDLPLIITGGEDAKIKFWSGHEIMAAQFVEQEEESIYFDIKCVKELTFEENTIPRQLMVSPSKNVCIIADAGLGGFLSLNMQTFEIERLNYGLGDVTSLSFVNSCSNIQPVNDLANGNQIRNALLAAIGRTGSVFVYDVFNRKTINITTSKNQKATVIQFIYNGLCLIVGFNDGTVNFYSCMVQEVGVPRFVYLINQFKVFNESIIDISCNIKGEVAVLGAKGSCFIFQTGLTLVKKDEAASASDGEQKLGEIGQQMVQATISQTYSDEKSKQQAEALRRNARGHVGITEELIQPVGYFILNQEDKYCKVQYLSDTQVLFAVSGCYRKEGRFLLIELPTCAEIMNYRASDPEQALQSTLDGQQPQSAISYNITHMITSKRPVNVFIPPYKLPVKLEKTVSKIEFQVTGDKIQALLPSKGQMQDLDAFEQPEDEEPDDDDEEEEDEEGGKKKKQKKKINDPLDEDASQSILFDFRQIRAVSSKGNQHCESDDFQLVCLLNVIAPPEIRTHAENAMDVIRQRAEQAAAGQQVNTSMQEDPATLCAALAVAELRASFRSQLIYIFNINQIQQNQTVQPVIQGEINTLKVIDQDLLPEDVCDDEKQRVENKQSCKIVLNKPLFAFSTAEQQLAGYIEDQAQQASLQAAYRSDYYPFGNIIAGMQDGQLYIQAYDTQADFEQLANETAANKKQYRYYMFKFAQKLTALEVGLAGHVIAVGDSSGCVYIIYTKAFESFSRFGRQPASSTVMRGYNPDEAWTNTQRGVQVSKQFPFRDEVVNLVNQVAKGGMKGKSQQPIEIVDEVLENTVEEQRLIGLDQLDNQKGLNAKQQIINKMKTLRDRFETVLRRNASQPVQYRLRMDELAPDLFLGELWMEREWERAKQIVQIEIGEMFNTTFAETLKLQQAFESHNADVTVTQFNRTFSKISTFKANTLPELEQELCHVLGIDSIDQLNNLENNNQSMEQFIQTQSNIFDEEQENAEHNLHDQLANESGIQHIGNEYENQEQFDQTKNETKQKTNRRGYIAPIPDKTKRVMRPVDKIVQQVLTGIKAKDNEINDAENKEKRIAERAALRKEKREALQRLIEHHESLPPIDEGDQKVLELLQKTIGNFVFKQDENYVEMISKLIEDAEKMGYPELINQQENKETKYLHFLLSLRAMDEAKRGFNAKVRQLFDQKIYIVQICTRLKEYCLTISALLKQKLGHNVYNELEDILTFSFPEEAYIDEIFSFIKLTKEEETQVVKQKMWDQFQEFRTQFEKAQTEEDAATRQKQLYYAIQKYQHKLFELFDVRDCDQLITEYINQCLTEKSISGEEASKLNQLVQQCKQQKINDKDMDNPLRSLYEDVSKVFETDLVQADINKQEDDKKATKQAADKQIDQEQEEGVCRPAISSFIHLIMGTSQPGQQQTNTYDPTGLISLFEKTNPSILFQQTLSYQVNLLVNIRRHIIQKIGSLIAAYDDCFNELLNEQITLQADFCKMRIKLITLFQECEIHHLYIRKDQNCLQKLENARNERKSISQQQEKLLQQINQRVSDAKEICTILRDLQEQFNKRVPEGPLRAKLFKMYNKKVKKVKVKAEKEQNENETAMTNHLAQEYMDDDEEESSDLSDDSDISSDSEELDETKPPENCDPDVFDSVLELRQEKREKDAKLQQIEIQCEQLRVQALNLSKKEKQIVASIDAAKNELTTFRASKQKELNAIQTGAIVDLASYYSLTKSGSSGAQAVQSSGMSDQSGSDIMLSQSVLAINTDLQDSILFNKKMLEQLQDRIQRRAHEIDLALGTIKQLMDAEKKQKNNLKFRQREFDEQNKKLVAIQNLKFGRQVDIEKLDGVVGNEEAKRLQKQYDDAEKQFNRDLNRNTREQEALREEMSVVMKENTRLVMKLKQMHAKGLSLDNAIINRQKQPPKAWCNDNRQELVRQEYNNLKQAIVDRERELKSLVDEISVLKNHNMR